MGESPKRRRPRGRLRARAAAFLAAIGTCLGGPAWAGSPYDRPSRLVQLPDGRNLNLVCSGHGSPTVILESGFGASASAWTLVQPQLARNTRVCSYDRAGYGFSDPGKLPRDGAAIARDLDYALRAAHERGPFVVVGHSAGGLYGRLFAARRVREVAGLVLVDTSVPFQDRRGGENSPRSKFIEGIRRHPEECLAAALAGSRKGLADAGCFTEKEPRSLTLALRPDTWRTQISELDALFVETSREAVRVRPVLRNVPVVLLTASPTGRPAGPEDPGGMMWQAAHRQEAAYFLRSEVQLVRSGHLIMIERPDAVVSALGPFLNLPPDKAAP